MKWGTYASGMRSCGKSGIGPDIYMSLALISRVFIGRAFISLGFMSRAFEVGHLCVRHEVLR